MKDSNSAQPDKVLRKFFDTSTRPDEISNSQIHKFRKIMS